jgi:DNA-binding response OmpR family regulator
MPKVMLVEDDANMFSLLCMLLEFEGYEVIAWDGNEDIESILTTIRREQPELVFLDVHLRHLSGFDLLRKLKNDPNLDRMRVLMASGMDLNYKCRQEGADGFILKPFMPDELIGVIQQTLS